jgi:hypothetical protein
MIGQCFRLSGAIGGVTPPHIDNDRGTIGLSGAGKVFSLHRSNAFAGMHEIFTAEAA